MMDSVADDDDDDEPPVNAAPAMPAPATGKQRALLALVIILGVLIVAAFAVLVGGLVMGVGGRSKADGPTPWSYTLDVPAGTHVASSELDGDRMLLHLASPAGEEVVLIDARTGRVLGRMQVKPPR